MYVSRESGIQKVTGSRDFQQWSAQMSGMLAQSPKREVYQVVE